MLHKNHVHSTISVVYIFSSFDQHRFISETHCMLNGKNKSFDWLPPTNCYQSNHLFSIRIAFLMQE